MDSIDATDISFVSGSGGLGLGSPSFTGSPAPGTDIPGLTTSGGGDLHSLPTFNGGSNSSLTPIGASTLPSPSQLLAGMGGSAAPNDAVNVSTPVGSFGLSSAGNYFMRAMVMFVGIIFLGVGLNMLRPGTVPMVPGTRSV